MESSVVSKWKDGLFDVLDRFNDCYDGEIDCLYWNSMVRRCRAGSGMLIASDYGPSSKDTYYSGWINRFFPYENQINICYHSIMSQRDTDFKEGESNDPNGNNSSFQENAACFDIYKMEEHYCMSKRDQNFMTHKSNKIDMPKITDDNSNEDSDDSVDSIDERLPILDNMSSEEKKKIELQHKRAKRKRERRNMLGWGVDKKEIIYNPLRMVNQKASTLKTFPIGITNAPVVLENVKTNTKHNLKFAAGFVGVDQDEKT